MTAVKNLRGFVKEVYWENYFNSLINFWEDSVKNLVTAILSLFQWTDLKISNGMSLEFSCTIMHLISSRRHRR